MLNALLINLAVVLASMLAWFVISILRQRVDVVDMGWGFGFILVPQRLLY